MRTELESAGKRLVKQEQIIMALVLGKEFGTCHEVSQKALLKKIKAREWDDHIIRKNSYLVIMRRKDRQWGGMGHGTQVKETF